MHIKISLVILFSDALDTWLPFAFYSDVLSVNLLCTHSRNEPAVSLTVYESETSIKRMQLKSIQRDDPLLN
jgi:hypothetical protein